MVGLLWLVPTLPLAGFAVLALGGGSFGRRGQALVGVGAVGVSAALAIAVAAGFLAHPPADGAVRQVLWSWMRIGGFAPDVGFRLDALSLVMMLVVTVVGFLIHLYSAGFMAGDPGHRRFFAWLNLFVAAMLVLVLADNLVLLYLGWEGVGLCSYLLIGFWYEDPANGAAARKAFFVTRIGDAAMLVGLFLLFAQLGTLQIQPMLAAARAHWALGSGPVMAASLLLLAGAVGKSAQLPLQTWLPDAMAGPTPVSALIHAATMVTAGVYLIARTHTLFALAPGVQEAVAAIGAATLLLAACSALTQSDIKRILAYSTISQVGYMMLALGVGGWSAGIFHLMTHAFFKSALFMAAGVVIEALDHEHDIFRMGGLARSLPWAFWCFLAGGASLAAVPVVTAGFYSKDLILWRAWNAPVGGIWLWLAGAVGAFLTALYIFRLIFVVFFGDLGSRPRRQPGWAMTIPLAVLSVLSVVGGLVQVPSNWGGPALLLPLLQQVLPAARTVGGAAEPWLQTVTALIPLAGIGFAWWLYGPRRRAQVVFQSGMALAVRGFWRDGWGFDRLYGLLVVRPFLALARALRDDPPDQLPASLADLARAAHGLLSRSQTGRLRWYASGIAAGAVMLIAIVVFG